MSKVVFFKRDPCYFEAMQWKNQSYQKRPCLFLDRDGVIIKNVPYSKDPNTVELMLGIVQLVKLAQQRNFLVIVVTNQSGIGRGWLTLEDYQRMTEKMEELLSVEAVRFDYIYFSPFYEKSSIPEFLEKPNWRKPGTGMIEQACRDFSIDLNQSIMIGDRSTDIEAAFGAGIARRVLLASGDLETEKAQIPRHINYEIAQDLRQITIA